MQGCSCWPSTTRRPNANFQAKVKAAYLGNAPLTTLLRRQQTPDNAAQDEGRARGGKSRATTPNGRLREWPRRKIPKRPRKIWYAEERREQGRRVHTKGRRQRRPGPDPGRRRRVPSHGREAAVKPSGRALCPCEEDSCCEIRMGAAGYLTRHELLPILCPPRACTDTQPQISTTHASSTENKCRVV